MVILSAINRWLASVLMFAIVALTVGMLGLLTAQVLLRYFVGLTLAWSEELSLAFFTWTVLLVAALGFREGFHVRMVLLLEPLRTVPRRVAETAIHLLSAGFGAYIAYAGYVYVDATRGMTSAAIAYPVGWLYAAVPVAGVLITLFSFENAIRGTVPAGLGEVENV